MAYTAPNDLFTSEEAILSLASSIADEDRTDLGNGTINGALDVLADALAERNVEVPPMNAGAILALAQYVGGGGGGGSVDVGEPVMVLIGDTPVVGNNIPDKFLFKGVSSGIGAQSPCVMGYSNSTFGLFTNAYGVVASGITITNFVAGGAVIGFYDVTVDMNDGTYSAIDEITSSVDYSVGSGNLLTFTIPAIEHDALIIAIEK